jgi:hypothetical protein
MFTGGSSAENEARITLAMFDYQDRKQDSFETLARVQEDLGRELAGAEHPGRRSGDGAPGRSAGEHRDLR